MQGWLATLKELSENLRGICWLTVAYGEAVCGHHMLWRQLLVNSQFQEFASGWIDFWYVDLNVVSEKKTKQDQQHRFSLLSSLTLVSNYFTFNLFLLSYYVPGIVLYKITKKINKI